MNLENSDQVSIQALFKTEALVISPADKPFLYTSGLLGPYYINTHYLCGGKEEAISILSLIDKEAENPDFYQTLKTRLDKIYEDHDVFRSVIDCCVKQVANSGTTYDFVSGGQRRDWFFSPLVAEKLELPHLSIYNDGRIFDQKQRLVEKLESSKVINIADLLTIGSSYTKKWAPFLSSIGGELLAALNVVDRLQGGREFLSEAGVTEVYSLFEIDEEFWNQAFSLELISEQQLNLVKDYLKDPTESMKKFLKENPGFVESMLKSDDEKIRKRAKLLEASELCQA